MDDKNSLLTESILMTVDNLFNRWLEPINIGGEKVVARISPLHGIIEQLSKRIKIFIYDFLHNLPRKGSGTRSSIQTSLGFRGRFGAYNLVRQLEPE